jgi:hypothetical protein
MMLCIMPIPVTSNTSLFQHAGGYVIVICNRCRHRRDIPARALASLIGWQSALRDHVFRFRCSQCQTKDADLSIGYDRKPRGWTHNPS